MRLPILHCINILLSDTIVNMEGLYFDNKKIRIPNFIFFLFLEKKMVCD